MSQQPAAHVFSAKQPENYEKFFVPVIDAPLAADLVRAAGVAQGDRVLDVACGTGVATRLAARQVGPTGHVVGVDISPAMVEVARSVTPDGLVAEWHEAAAEALPVEDDSFDVVLCQLSLQFMPDRPAALREMRRALAPGGRVAVNVPGPIMPVFDAMAGAIERHLGPQGAGFVRAVFSLHDTDEIAGLLTAAGFEDVHATAEEKALPLPPARQFVWQYMMSTPLAAAVSGADEPTRRALEDDVAAGCKPFESGEGLEYRQRVVTATGRA